MHYVLILIAVLLLALQFSMNKAYSLRRGSSATASLKFSIMTGGTCAVISALTAILTEGGLKFTPYSLLMAVIVAVLCCTYTFIGFRIMSIGSMSVFTMFLMLGGMLLPYLFGVFFLDETVSVCRVIGVIILAASMVFPVLARSKGGKSNLTFVLLCAAVFVLNGGVSITSKLHQITEIYETSPSASFSVLSNLSSCVISLIALLVIGARNKAAGKEEEKFTPAEGIKNTAGVIALIVVANAAFGGISYILQLVSAGNVPASVLYPMITGGSMALSALAGYVFFGEKPDRLSLIGLIISFAATFLFLF